MLQASRNDPKRRGHLSGEERPQPTKIAAKVDWIIVIEQTAVKPKLATPRARQWNGASVKSFLGSVTPGFDAVATSAKRARKRQMITRGILETTNFQREVEGENRGRCDGSYDNPMPRGFVYNFKTHNTRSPKDLSVILDVSWSPKSFKFSRWVNSARSTALWNCASIAEPSAKFPPLLPVVCVRIISHDIQPTKRMAKNLIDFGRNPGIVAIITTTWEKP